MPRGKAGPSLTHNMAADSHVATHSSRARSWSSRLVGTADFTCVVALTRSKDPTQPGPAAAKWHTPKVATALHVSTRLQECCWPPQAGGQRFKPNWSVQCNQHLLRVMPVATGLRNSSAARSAPKTCVACVAGEHTTRRQLRNVGQMPAPTNQEGLTPPAEAGVSRERRKVAAMYTTKRSHEQDAWSLQAGIRQQGARAHHQGLTHCDARSCWSI